MKTLSKLFFATVILCLTLSVSAQETYYYVFDYMKTKPGMYRQYLETEAAWKKIHAAKKAAGSIDNWTLMEIVSPYGSSTEYNFVTRIRLKGEAQLAGYMEGPYMPENWTSLLTPEEIRLVNETRDTRSLVKSETFSSVERVLGENVREAPIAVVNFFDFPEGKSRADHVRVERDIWMPAHKSRIESGELEGWVLARMVMPGGSAMPYHDVTVDIYKNFEQMLTDDPRPSLKKVHEGKKIADLFKETSANTDLVRREIRREVDSL